MEKIKYTEFSERFAGSEGNDIAVIVQVPDDVGADLNDILLIVQEPKLVKFTLTEFQGVEEIVYRALKEAGWKEERAGDGLEPG